MEEELQKTIDKLQDIMSELADIDINTTNRRNKTYYQNKLNRAFEKIFNLKKHLEFLLHVGG